MYESKIIKRKHRKHYYEAAVYVGTHPELGEMWQDCGIHATPEEAAAAIAAFITLRTAQPRAQRRKFEQNSYLTNPTA